VKTTVSSGTSETFYQTTRRHVTENTNILMYRHVNLRCHRRIPMVCSGNIIYRGSIRLSCMLKDKCIAVTCYASTEGEYKNSSTHSLASSLEGGGWSTPRPGHLTPGKIPGTQFTGGYVVIWVSPGGCVEDEVPCFSGV